MKKTAILYSIVLLVGAAIGAYLMGMWKDKQQVEAVNTAVQVEKDNRAAIEADLASTKLDKQMADFKLRLGAIAIEAARLNYGTAKDNAVQFFTELSEFAETAKGTAHEQTVMSILEARDQVVSDLSVGSPTAAETMQRMYLELE